MTRRPFPPDINLQAVTGYLLPMRITDHVACALRSAINELYSEQR